MRIVKAVLVLLCVLGAVALGVAWLDGRFAGPVVPRSGAPPWAARRAVPGLENFGEVVPGKVFRGAQPDAQGYASLRALGVKTVVNLRWAHDEADAVRKAGMEPVAIPIQADWRGSEPPSYADVRRFLDLATDPAHLPLYFHCAQGRDRTGTMCALYRMEVSGWSPEDAWLEMQSFGFNQIWTDLRTFVQGYQPLSIWRRR